STAAPTSRWHATRPMLVTTMVNLGWSPTKYCGSLGIPLTANVESGQSSPSLSTGGGMTAAVGVGVGGGACWAGGITGVLTSGFSPGSGVGAAGPPGGGVFGGLVLGARAVHHDHHHHRCDDADDEDRYAQRECPASQVNLRR